MVKFSKLGMFCLMLLGASHLQGAAKTVTDNVVALATDLAARHGFRTISNRVLVGGAAAVATAGGVAGYFMKRLRTEPTLAVEKINESAHADALASVHAAVNQVDLKHLPTMNVQEQGTQTDLPREISDAQDRLNTAIEEFHKDQDRDKLIVAYNEYLLCLSAHFDIFDRPCDEHGNIIPVSFPREIVVYRSPMPLAGSASVSGSMPAMSQMITHAGTTIRFAPSEIVSDVSSSSLLVDEVGNSATQIQPAGATHMLPISSSRPAPITGTQLPNPDSAPVGTVFLPVTPVAAVPLAMVPVASAAPRVTHLTPAPTPALPVATTIVGPVIEDEYTVYEKQLLEIEQTREQIASEIRACHDLTPMKILKWQRALRAQQSLAAAVVDALQTSYDEVDSATAELNDSAAVGAGYHVPNADYQRMSKRLTFLGDKGRKLQKLLKTMLLTPQLLRPVRSTQHDQGVGQAAYMRGATARARTQLNSKSSAAEVTAGAGSTSTAATAATAGSAGAMGGPASRTASSVPTATAAAAAASGTR